MTEYFAGTDVYEERKQELLRQQRANEQIVKGGIVQRVLTTILSAATTPSFYKTRPLLLDCSHYEKVDWQQMKGKIAGGIPKLGEVDDRMGSPLKWTDAYKDTEFHPNVQGLADIDAICGAFFMENCAWVVNAGMSIGEIDKVDEIYATDKMLWARNVLATDLQMRLIVEQVKIINDQNYLNDPARLMNMSSRRIHFLAPDMERWWLSYNEWLANPGTARRIDPGGYWMEKSLAIRHERLTKFMALKLLPTMPILPYSGSWVYKTYSPPLANRINIIGKSWWAKYYWSSGAVTTIENFIEKYLGIIPDAWRVTDGAGDIVFTQLTDSFKFPGVTNGNGAQSAIDVNVYMKSLGELNAWLGIGTVPPIPPVENPDLEAIIKRVLELESSVDALEASVRSINDEIARQKDLFKQLGA